MKHAQATREKLLPPAHENRGQNAREHFALGLKKFNQNVFPRNISKSMNSREDFIDFDLKRLI